MVDIPRSAFSGSYDNDSSTSAGSGSSTGSSGGGGSDDEQDFVDQVAGAVDAAQERAEDVADTVTRREQQSNRQTNANDDSGGGGAGGGGGDPFADARDAVAGAAEAVEDTAGDVADTAADAAGPVAPDTGGSGGQTGSSSGTSTAQPQGSASGNPDSSTTSSAGSSNSGSQRRQTQTSSETGSQPVAGGDPSGLEDRGPAGGNPNATQSSPNFPDRDSGQPDPAAGGLDPERIAARNDALDREDLRRTDDGGVAIREDATLTTTDQNRIDEAFAESDVAGSDRVADPNPDIDNAAQRLPTQQEVEAARENARIRETLEETSGQGAPVQDELPAPIQETVEQAQTQNRREDAAAVVPGVEESPPPEASFDGSPFAGALAGSAPDRVGQPALQRTQTPSTVDPASGGFNQTVANDLTQGGFLAEGTRELEQPAEIQSPDQIPQGAEPEEFLEREIAERNVGIDEGDVDVRGSIDGDYDIDVDATAAERIAAANEGVSPDDVRFKQTADGRVPVTESGGFDPAGGEFVPNEAELTSAAEDTSVALDAFAASFSASVTRGRTAGFAEAAAPGDQFDGRLNEVTQAGVRSAASLANVPGIIQTGETATEVATNLPGETLENAEAVGATTAAATTAATSAGVSAVKEDPAKTGAAVAGGLVTELAAGAAIGRAIESVPRTVSKAVANRRSTLGEVELSDSTFDDVADAVERGDVDGGNIPPSFRPDASDDDLVDTVERTQSEEISDEIQDAVPGDEPIGINVSPSESAPPKEGFVIREGGKQRPDDPEGGLFMAPAANPVVAVDEAGIGGPSSSAAGGLSLDPRNYRFPRPFSATGDDAEAFLIRGEVDVEPDSVGNEAATMADPEQSLSELQEANPNTELEDLVEESEDFAVNNQGRIVQQAPGDESQFLADQAGETKQFVRSPANRAMEEAETVAPGGTAVKVTDENLGYAQVGDDTIRLRSGELAEPDSDDLPIEVGADKSSARLFDPTSRRGASPDTEADAPAGPFQPIPPAAGTETTVPESPDVFDPTSGVSAVSETAAQSGSATGSATTTASASDVASDFNPLPSDPFSGFGESAGGGGSPAGPFDPSGDFYSGSGGFNDGFSGGSPTPGSPSGGGGSDPFDPGGPSQTGTTGTTVGSPDIPGGTSRRQRRPSPDFDSDEDESLLIDRGFAPAEFRNPVASASSVLGGVSDPATDSGSDGVEDFDVSGGLL